MKYPQPNLALLQVPSAQQPFYTQPVSSGDVFTDRTGSYLNELTFYTACFNYAPNLISENDINARKANQWFAAQYRQEISNVYFNKRCFRKKGVSEYDDIFYFLYEDLVVNLDVNCSTVRFLFRKTDYNKVEAIISAFRRHRNRRFVVPQVQVLIYKSGGIDTEPLDIRPPKLQLTDNYNDDFIEVHNNIIKRLSRKHDKGIVLLHGKPGTGKTSYIRYLITKLKKDVIFLPPGLANAITNPDLLPLLLRNTNSVFVIEDAENIVMHRELKGQSPVSALLNISDGLLSDCLNIQIICSFNTDVNKIDPALLRKGRLIAKYEFKELEVNKAQALSDKLGYERKVTSPTTLTAIYNQDEPSFEPLQRTRIGFNIE